MGGGEAVRGPVRQRQRQRLLDGAQLEALEVVVGEGDVDVLEVLAGEAQDAVEDGGDIGVGGRRQRRLVTVDAPEGLGDEEVEVEVRSQLHITVDFRMRTKGSPPERTAGFIPV